MKYYQELMKLGVFSFEQAASIIRGNNASRVLNSYVDSGYIRKVKHNLYICVDLATSADVYGKYDIGSRISDNSFLIGHTAFEFYGYYNQVFYNCQVGSMRRFKEFEYDDISYECFTSKTLKQVEIVQDVKVTSLERTIVDSIDLLGKVMDLEELLKCIDIIPMVNEERIKEMLLEYDKEILYRKVGYILSYFKKSLNISDSFFDFCINHSKSNNRGKISNYEYSLKLEYIPRWNLYAYKDLLKIIQKGADVDV